MSHTTLPLDVTTYEAATADAGSAAGNVVRFLSVPQVNARLVSRDGSTVELPEELHAILKQVAALLEANQAVTIVPNDKELTTQQAAELLGVSRPTLVKRLEAGEIPYHTINRHRRVRMSDLIAYRERLRSDRREILDDMARVANESGLYEATATPPHGIR